MKRLLALILTIISCQTNHPVSEKVRPVDVSDPSSYNNQTLLIDPSTIPASLFLPITDHAKRGQLEKKFEKGILSGQIDVSNYQPYIPILFFYRDKRVVKLLREIVRDTSAHLYLRMLSVYALGECGDRSSTNLLLSEFSNTNPLYREYIASALLKLTDSTGIDTIQSLLKNEKNAYVFKTLQARKKDSAWIGGILPLFDTSEIKKELFFSNDLSGYYADFHYQQIDSIPDVTVTKGCNYPHQQYKEDRAFCQLINYPLISFGMMGAWGMHVGEDSGWLYPGLPVHAIMDGVIVKVQHESTWGCLVIMQSRLRDNSLVTIYYGHLSDKLNVRIGDIVTMGDKIGETAMTFTLTNGGYFSHLHLGIEKATFKKALVKGWSDTDKYWYSPVAFIAKYNTCHP